MSIRVFLSLLLFLSVPAHAEDATANQREADIAKMLELAHQAKLAQRPEWLKINLYHSSITGITSRVDDPTYFLAPDGKHDPQAELLATIRGAFDGTMAKTSRQPNVCRWIARYQFLSRSMKELGFDYTPMYCEGFERWSSGIATHKLTLVFASVYLNSPASMYGHAFVRFDSDKPGEYNRLNDSTVGYSVQDPGGNTAMFLVRSLFGGYPGSFVFVPYYMKIREYSDLENRDLWEYQTSLSSEEIQRMLAFIWEQSFTYMNYYFFDDNCALMLLASFEAARPSLNALDQAKPWFIPLDMVKLLRQQPGLIEKIHFRPSQYNTLLRNYKLASASEQEHAFALQEDDRAIAALDKLDAREQGRVLDLAMGIGEYQRNQKHSQEEAADITARLLKLSGIRSKVDAASEYNDQEPPQERPDEGHDSLRAGLAYGQVGSAQYAQLNLRGGYHDGLDPQSGFTPGASSKIGDLYLRLNGNQVRFERLDLFDVFVPSVQTEWVKPQTIKLNVSVRRDVLQDDALGPTALRVQAAGGKSYGVGDAARFYVLADTLSRFGPTTSFSVGPSVGMFWAPALRWRMELSANTYWNAYGDVQDAWQYQLKAGLAKDIYNNQNSMRLSIVRQGLSTASDPSRSFTDVQLAYYHYF